MSDQPDQDLLKAVITGDERAFEQLYATFAVRVRLVAWRITHRADWVDDLVNETWCRAFDQRTGFDPSRQFLVWMVGILRNVYRELCRKSYLTISPNQQTGEGVERKLNELSPEKLASEAELLAALQGCVEGLDPTEAKIVQLRFFQELPLRAVAEELKIAEATLRDVRLPGVYKKLRLCLKKKNIDIDTFFPAQGGGQKQ